MATLADLQKQIANLQKQADSQRYTSYDRINREGDYKGTIQVDLDKAISNIDRRNLPQLPSTMAAYGKTKSELARLQKQYANMQKQTASQPQQPAFTGIKPGVGVDLLTGQTISTPQTFNYTYEQAVAANATRVVKSPAQQAAIDAALARGPSTGANNMIPAQPPLVQTSTEELAKKATSPTDVTVTPVTQTVQPTEVIDRDQGLTSPAPTVTPKTIDPASVGQVAAPAASEGLGVVGSTTLSSPQIKNAVIEGAKSTLSVNDLVDLDDISTATLSSEAFANAATAELDERGTVKYQLSELFAGIEDGKPLPPWASPAVRKVSAIMQQRGLGASSMAAAAVTQAVMESGISIASQDAKMYASLQFKNLDNQQQAALQNALQTATLDRQNADARTRGAISNAQALLSIDLKELDAQQQSNALKFNAITKAALTDAAAENATQQINAKNEIQVEEFFAELTTQIDAANIARDVAIRQYNISQENAYAEFNANMMDQRDKFNANMKFAIDQSNVQWRRQINTANTAVQNETNRINVQNMYNASQTALNQLWQQYRDNATFNFTASESKQARDHEMAIVALEVAATEKAYSDAQKTSIANNVIKVIGNWGSRP